MTKQLVQLITRMNPDFSVSNHTRKLDDMYYRPLNKLRVRGPLSDDEVLTLCGPNATLIKSGTTSQGYVRLLEVTDD